MRPCYCIRTVPFQITNNDQRIVVTSHLRYRVAAWSILVDGLRSCDGDSDIVPSSRQLRFVSNDELIFQRLDDVVDFEHDLVAFVNFHETLPGPSGRSFDRRRANDHLSLSLTAGILGFVTVRTEG